MSFEGNLSQAKTSISTDATQGSGITVSGNQRHRLCFKFASTENASLRYVHYRFSVLAFNFN